ncbi:hypothetical protein N0V93_000297 [Gnomoniopsis smithogilvyi]|uniref:Uncharacterized protein n=1 Tax=Gnomoniopsis smithogilvyi TaxID=1191159 RepID=A0A9W9D1K4_9PEZI|nr:hypothetical protein N0V93_000297 [Gnomoniopsis smithogilvyi]
MGSGSIDAMLEPSPAPTMVDATFPGPASTSAPSPEALLDKRQIIITITVTTSNPSATISSLSSSLISAQRSISLLASELQQVQLASVSAVTSAQSAAAASALSTIASVSSSAALALASASTLVANANAAAVAASRSADAAIANASTIQAQADLSRQLNANRFTETQLAIAVVVSIIGTLALSLIGFLFFAYYRERREKKRRRELKELILRPDTTNSSGSGDVAATPKTTAGPTEASHGPDNATSWTASNANTTAACDDPGGDGTSRAAHEYRI